MQSNQDVVNLVDSDNSDKNDKNKKLKHIILHNLFIIEVKIWEEILSKLKSKENLDSIINYIHVISKKYNTDKKSIIKEFLNYIIRNNSIELNNRFLDFVENTMHLQNINNNIIINYFLSTIMSFV